MDSRRTHKLTHHHDLRLAELRTTLGDVIRVVSVANHEYQREQEMATSAAESESATIEPSVRSINGNLQASFHCSSGPMEVAGVDGHVRPANGVIGGQNLAGFARPAAGSWGMVMDP
jgi:hypothetical protein